MRLWKLSELAQDRLVIHICEICNFRTPISPKLHPFKNTMDFSHAISIEIKNNLCDTCNSKIWLGIQEYSSHRPE